MSIGNHNFNTFGFSKSNISDTLSEHKLPTTNQQNFNAQASKPSGFEFELLMVSDADSTKTDLDNEFSSLHKSASTETSSLHELANKALPSEQNAGGLRSFKEHVDTQTPQQHLTKDNEVLINDIQPRIVRQQHVTVEAGKAVLNEGNLRAMTSQVVAHQFNAGASPIRESTFKSANRVELQPLSAQFTEKTVAVSELKVNSEVEPSYKRELTQNLFFKASVPTKGSTSAEVGQKLTNILADKITLQSNTKVSNATIRLDPPELGKLDLFVRVEGDRLNVHINSSVNSVRDAIAQTIERLRVELVQENFLEVNVTIGDNKQAEPDWQDERQDERVKASTVKGNYTSSKDDDFNFTTSEQVLARV